MKKKTIILSSTAIIILVAAIGIGIRLMKQPSIAENKSEEIPQESQKPVIVNINSPEPSATPEPTSEITVRPEKSIPQEQENVPVPDKPTKKPNPPKATGSYTNPNSPPAYSEQDTVKEPSKKTPLPSAESSQDTKEKKYVEGFGYVDIGGPNQGKVVDSDGDINKQVGSMD